MRFTSFSFVFVAIFLSLSCGEETKTVNREMPQQMIWAWENDNDLSGINIEQTGVAFLAQTIYLDGDTIRLRPRRQPLNIPEGVYLIAVTRIEALKGQHAKPTYNNEQLEEISRLVLKTLDKENVRGVQTDFDVVVSERAFYRRLLADLRAKLPAERSLTMTALASWCAGDNWISSLPVDEAVPMIFEMGADSESIKAFLKRGEDWREPLCRQSYGISEKEPIEGLKSERRVYIFR